jgi:hypothetical protein
MNKLIKEPLLHFMVIGVLIFAGDIERLASNWSKKWHRQPTESELKGLVDSYIKEEVYYREALALGLDQDDTILRRRLMQKMEFLSNDLAELGNPDEAALNDYFLTHIYFNLDKQGNRIFDTAGKVLADIQAASPPISHAPDRGDSFMLQYDFTLETPFEVSRLFGQQFTEELFQTATSNWQGPIASGYGLHLVRISEKVDARMPELASVIDRVRTDYMFEQRQKTNKAIYERFKERYEIVVEDMPDQSGKTAEQQTKRTAS